VPWLKDRSRPSWDAGVECGCRVFSPWSLVDPEGQLLPYSRGLPRRSLVAIRLRDSSGNAAHGQDR
jgi:hypothetical protein